MSEKAFSLSNVTIEGLRGVGRVELSFSPEPRVVCLFGKNGVGKTKCLEALYQFSVLTNKDFYDYVKIHPIMQSNFVARKIVAGEYTFDLTDSSNYRNYLFNEDATYFHQLPVVFLGAERRASLNVRNEYSAPLGNFETRRTKYFEALWKAFATEGGLRSLGMSSGDTRDWFIQRVQAASPRYKSKNSQEAEIKAVLSMLHSIEPLIDADFLEVDDDDEISLKVDGKEKKFNELSSGYAALLKIIQAIVAGYAAFTNEVQLQNVRGFVFIDEIDAHLHAEWQVKIIPCLKKLFPNTTFYVATHSPLVLMRLTQKEAYKLERREDGVVWSRMIEYPNKRLFVDTLEDATGVDLNKEKRKSAEDDNQSDIKQRMLSIMRKRREVMV
jgi:predicted ATPase